MAGILGKDANIKGQKEDPAVTLFNIGTIASATNNFSPTNKLGEGGFGPVYKVHNFIEGCAVSC